MKKINFIESTDLTTLEERFCFILDNVQELIELAHEYDFILLVNSGQINKTRTPIVNVEGTYKKYVIGQTRTYAGTLDYEWPMTVAVIKEWESKTRNPRIAEFWRRRNK